MLLFSRLVSKLHTKVPTLISCCRSDSVISSLLFQGDENEIFHQETLYIVFGDKALIRKRFPHNLMVIYRDTEQLQRLESWLSNTDGPVNVLYISDDQYEYTINYAQGIIVQSQKHGERYAEFLKMIVNGKDLSYLLSEGAKQCDRQLIALDFSGKILGSSTKQNYLTPDWIEALKNGYCPADFMKHLYDRLLTRTEITSQPFIYLCDETGLTYLSSPVIIDGSASGYVFLLSETEEFDPVAYEILPILSKAVADYLKRVSPDYGEGNQAYLGLIRDVLRGEAHDSVESRIQSLKLSIPKVMRVLLIRAYYFEREKEILKTLIPQLFGPGSLTPIRYEDKLIVLQDVSPANAERNQKAMDFLSNLAVNNQLYVGASNVFYQLDQLPERYVEAQEALKLAAKLHIQKNVVFYSEVAFFSMLCKLPISERMQTFCHPALDILRRYDADNGTDLFRNCNQKQASEILYTHRNTINYRRQQIIELTGIDFQNTELLFQLNYSFKIYHFFGL